MAAEPLRKRFPALARLARRRHRQRRVPFVEQSSRADCGAACLAMVLAHHGCVVRLDDVRAVTGFGRDGAGASALVDAARHFGLRGRGISIEQVRDLARLAPGAVLHWRFNHWVVLEKVSRRGLHLVDPAVGRITVPFERAERAFTGIVLVFEPSGEFRRKSGETATLWGYLRRLLVHAAVLRRTLVVSGMLQLFALAVPLVMGLVVDRVVPEADLSLLAVLSAGAAVMGLFYGLAALLRSRLMVQLQTQVDAQMSLDFLDHLVELPYSFFQQRSTGDLMMRISSNATIREIITSGLFSSVLDGLLVCGYLVLLFLADAGMGLVVLALGALRVAVFLALRGRNTELMATMLQRQAASDSYQVQMLSGMGDLKAAGAEPRAVERWSNLFVDVLNVGLARGRLRGTADAILATLTFVSPLVILVYGAHLTLDGALSLGAVLASYALAMGFLAPLSELVSSGFRIHLLESYLDRIQDVLDTPPEQERSAVRRAPRLRGGISLQGVSFRYAPGSPLVLDRVSLDVEPGQFVAIVGPSGAGKSTLASLLLGLFRPSAGRVLFDGNDLFDFDLRSIRRQISYVPQNPYLFGQSIRSNIALTDPSLPLGRVVEAARRAAVHDDILGLPLGYGTVLADAGASLSGGQRQRIALARALVERPEILILDEATSALDAIIEQRVQEEIASLRCTRIVIAHRLSTIRQAEQILVLDGGRLVQRGRHGELLAGGGVYADLVRGQLG